MPCRDKKIDGKFIQEGDVFLGYPCTQRHNTFKLFVIRIYISCSLTWSQGKDENDPNKDFLFHTICSDPSHMKEKLRGDNMYEIRNDMKMIIQNKTKLKEERKFISKK